MSLLNHDIQSSLLGRRKWGILAVNDEDVTLYGGNVCDSSTFNLILFKIVRVLDQLLIGNTFRGIFSFGQVFERNNSIFQHIS